MAQISFPRAKREIDCNVCNGHGGASRLNPQSRTELNSTEIPRVPLDFGTPAAGREKQSEPANFAASWRIWTREHLPGNLAAAKSERDTLHGNVPLCRWILAHRRAFAA